MARKPGWKPATRPTPCYTDTEYDFTIFKPFRWLPKAVFAKSSLSGLKHPKAPYADESLDLR
jgi:hypothetical protein